LVVIRTTVWIQRLFSGLITIERYGKWLTDKMKQLTWPRTALCGGWCLHMALRTPSGACQKRKRNV